MSSNDIVFKLAPMYRPGVEQARQDLSLGVSITLTLIAMLCVALRIYTRACFVRNMGNEDWTIILAATTTIVLLLQLIINAKKFKMGFSGFDLTPDEMEGSIKLGLALIVVYKLTVTLIKISILFIYLRIAITRMFERLCQGTIIFLLIWQMIVTILVPSQCRPLRKLWDFAGTVEGKCINANDFYYITSMLHILIDVWILALPIKLIMSIPRPPREKLALYFVFCLGIISMVASIIRFTYLVLLSRSEDPFFDSLPINTWSVVEVNIGILCASIPTLRPLFSKSQRDRTRDALTLGYSKRSSRKKMLTPPPHNRIISISIMSVSDTRNPEVSENDIELQKQLPPPVPQKDFNVRWSDRKRPLNSQSIKSSWNI